MTLKKDELLLEELLSAPATPASGKWKVYFKSGGLYIVDDAGNETGPFGAGGLTSGPQAFGDNYVITPSVASNNLTVALKTVAGADPSASDKITVRIGNTKREITSAISVTKNAGTNWMNCGSAALATKDVDFFVYLIQETGASAGTKIGFSRIPYARTMVDFVNTTTSEKYIAGNWTNFNNTDVVENIGRFRARLSAGAGYTWSIPTAVVINRPIYETDWLDWVPTWATSNLGGTTGTFSTVTVVVAKYRILGVKKCEFEIRASGTLGGSACPFVTATVPFEAAWSSTNIVTGAMLFVDGSATPGAFGGIFISAASPDLMCFEKYNAANWHTSGTGAVDGNGFYETE